MAQEIKKSETGGAAAPRYMDPFSAMRSEMDRVFDTFLGRGPRNSLGRMAFAAPSDNRFLMSPDIDVRETAQEYVIEAELPGLDEKDVSVTLNDGVLTLKGEKKTTRDESKDDYHLTERSFGSFQRSFDIADAVDPEQVKASFEKGVLKIVMPKRPEAARMEKKIPIGKG